jgi:hypothetical protein
MDGFLFGDRPVLLDFNAFWAPYAALHMGDRMGIGLKTSFVVTAGVIAIASAYLAISDYRARHSVEAIEQNRLADAVSAERQTIQRRVNALASDGCQARALELLALNSKRPIRSASDVPPALHDDLSLCLARGAAYAYVRADLDDAGLSKFLGTVE